MEQAAIQSQLQRAGDQHRIQCRGSRMVESWSWSDVARGRLNKKSTVFQPPDPYWVPLRLLYGLFLPNSPIRIQKFAPDPKASLSPMFINASYRSMLYCQSGPEMTIWHEKHTLKHVAMSCNNEGYYSSRSKRLRLSSSFLVRRTNQRCQNPSLLPLGRRTVGMVCKACFRKIRQTWKARNSLNQHKCRGIISCKC